MLRTWVIAGYGINFPAFSSPSSEPTLLRFISFNLYFSVVKVWFYRIEYDPNITCVRICVFYHSANLFVWLWYSFQYNKCNWFTNTKNKDTILSHYLQPISLSWASQSPFTWQLANRRSSRGKIPNTFYSLWTQCTQRWHLLVKSPAKKYLLKKTLRLSDTSSKFLNLSGVAKCAKKSLNH